MSEITESEGHDFALGCQYDLFAKEAFWILSTAVRLYLRIVT